MAIKLSIGLMLLRFLQELHHRIAIWILICVFELYNIAVFIVITVACTPVSFFWTHYRGATHGKCLKVTPILIDSYVFSALNCVVDWTFAIIPWFILRNLQLDRRTKVLTSLALSLGAL